MNKKVHIKPCRFEERKKINQDRLKTILDDLIKGKIPADTTPLKQAVVYYKSCKNLRRMRYVGDSRLKVMKYI